MKDRTLLHVLLAACLAAVPVPRGAAQEPSPAPAVPHALPGSNTLSYWYGGSYHTPFVLRPDSAQAADIPRNSLEYTHMDFWSLGSNFADVLLNQSGMAEPASSGGTGATEVYVILRSSFGLNAITGTHAFHLGPVRDIALEGGANLETKNSSYAPAERTLYLGPNLQFGLPRGYLNVGLHFRKEWNHEGVLGKSEDYSPDFNIEPAWMLPFSLGGVHLAYSGFADYNTPKGKDSFGTSTASEFLLRNTVALDLGSLFVRRAQLVELNAGFWYWHNEYGKPPTVPGSEQMTPVFGIAFHPDSGRTRRRN